MLMMLGGVYATSMHARKENKRNLQEKITRMLSNMRRMWYRVVSCTNKKQQAGCKMLLMQMLQCVKRPRAPSLKKRNYRERLEMSLYVHGKMSACTIVIMKPCRSDVLQVC